jgi:hypothetical protein
MSAKAYHTEADLMLSRLNVLPPRLRIAHLAALARCGRLIVRDGSLSYPSPRKGEGSTAPSSKPGSRAE